MADGPQEMDRESVRKLLEGKNEEQRASILSRMKERGITLKDAAAPPAADSATGDVEGSGRGGVMRKVGEFAAQHGLEMAGAGEGAAEGAALGLAAGGPIGMGLGAVGGAAIGGGAGKAVQSGMEASVNLVRPGTNPKRTPTQVLAGVQKTGGEMGAAEVVARPVAAVAGKAASAAWGAIKPAATKLMSPIAERGILAARELGIPLTYAEFSQSKTAAQMESLAKKIPFLSDVMARADRAKTAALNEARTTLLSGLGEAPAGGEHALGESARASLTERLDGVERARQQRYGALRSGAQGNLGLNAPPLPEQRTAAVLASKGARDESMHAYRGVLYDRADAALADPAAPVPLTNLKKAAGGVVSSYGEGSAKSLRGAAYSAAKDYTKEAAPAVGGMDPALAARLKANPAALARQPAEIQAAVKAATEDKTASMTPRELRAEISNLGDAAEGTRRPDGSYTKDGKHFLEMRRAAKADLDAHYAVASPESKRAYALADAFHGDYSDRMRNDTIARLYKEAPSQTFDAIVKSGDADLTGKLAAALGPDGKAVLKRQLFDTVFGVDQAVPDAKTIIKNLSDYGPGIRAVFKPAEVGALRSFALTGEAPPFVQSEFERIARGLIKQDPEKLSASILSGNANMARAAKKYLPPETFKAYGRQLAENILASSTEPEVGFRDVLKRLDAKADILGEFFPKSTIDGMRKIGEAAQILPGYGDLAMRPPSASGSAVAMGMWGIILHPSKLVTGGVAVSLMGAHQLAELYTSDTGRRWITTMMRMPANDPRVANLAARGVQLAARAVAANPSLRKKVAEKAK